MAKLWRLISEQTLQYSVFIGLSLIAFILTGIIFAQKSASFQRFFGRVNPLLVVFAVFVLGLILLSLLLSKSQFAIYRPGNIKGLLIAIGLAVPFGVVMILADHRIVFSADTNIAYPESLMFYPAIGYVAEILFHVLPFTLLYFSLNAILGGSNQTTIIWISIVLASLAEAIFQSVFMVGQYPAWAVAYVGLHVFLISFAQLFLFWRYDFITMYAFRLSYYLIWHILWGHLRLSLLF